MQKLRKDNVMCLELRCIAVCWYHVVCMYLFTTTTTAALHPFNDLFWGQPG